MGPGNMRKGIGQWRRRSEGMDSSPESDFTRVFPVLRRSWQLAEQCSCEDNGRAVDAEAAARLRVCKVVGWSCIRPLDHSHLVFGEAAWDRFKYQLYCPFHPQRVTQPTTLHTLDRDSQPARSRKKSSSTFPYPSRRGPCEVRPSFARAPGSKPHAGVKMRLKV